MTVRKHADNDQKTQFSPRVADSGAPRRILRRMRIFRDGKTCDRFFAMRLASPRSARHHFGGRSMTRQLVTTRDYATTIVP
jgi:hypothetical protein